MAAQRGVEGDGSGASPGILIATVFAIGFFAVGCEAPPDDLQGHSWTWWVERLHDQNPAAREEATVLVGKWPQRPAAALLPLAYASLDRDAAVRVAALEAIAPHARACPGTLTVLERGLLDFHPDVRIAAAGSLESLGADAAPAIPRLAAAAMDDDRRASSAATRAIAATGASAVPILLEWLGGTEEKAIYAGLNLFERLSEPVTPAVPLFLRLLDDPRPRVRGWAMGYCSKVGPAGLELLPRLIANCVDDDFLAQITVRDLARVQGKVVVPVLLEYADHPNHQIRAIALSCLISIPEARAMALDRLTRIPWDPSPEARASVLAVAMIEAGDAPREETGEVEAPVLPGKNWEWLIPAAEECLQDPVGDVRRWAERFLCTVCPPTEDDALRLDPSRSCDDRERLRILSRVNSDSALSAVRYWLQDGPPVLRAAAAAALVDRVRPGDEEAALLARSLGDEDPRVRYEAVRALERFGQQEVARGLLGLLSDSDAEVRRQTLWVLVQNRPAWAEPLSDLLTAALRDSDSRVRRSAVRGLSKLDPPAQGVAHDLVLALYDTDREVRDAAVDGLRDLRLAPPEALSVLLGRLRDHSFLVRRNALGAIGRIAAPGPEVVRAVREALSDPMESNALLVPATLAALGSEALSDLLEVARHGDSGVRERAMQTLGSLANPSREVRDALLRGLRDPKEEVRIAALRGLRPRLRGDQDVRKAVNRALRDRRPAVQRLAKRLLDGIGAAEESD